MQIFDISSDEIVPEGVGFSFSSDLLLRVPHPSTRLPPLLVFRDFSTSSILFVHLDLLSTDSVSLVSLSSGSVSSLTAYPTVAASVPRYIEGLTSRFFSVNHLSTQFVAHTHIA